VYSGLAYVKGENTIAEAISNTCGVQMRVAHAKSVSRGARLTDGTLNTGITATLFTQFLYVSKVLQELEASGY
jgi:hypothetical protein